MLRMFLEKIMRNGETDMGNQTAESGEEKCVRCGNKTGVSKNTPVDSREHYVEGGGQLCRKCWAMIYTDKN